MSLNYSQKSSKLKVRKNLGYLQPQALAKKMKLTQRASRKCTPTDLILAVWQTFIKGLFSFDHIALNLSTQRKQLTISGQAVWKRLTDENFNLFVKALLNKSLKRKCDSLMDSELFKSFSNIFIGDATHYKLAAHLADDFPPIKIGIFNR